MFLMLFTAGAPLDIPGQTLDLVIDTLQRVGVPVSPFLLQLFLLILTLVLFVLLLPTLRSRKHGAARKVAVVGLGLIGFGILWSWGEQLLVPLPPELSGYITVSNVNEASPQAAYQGMYVELHDYRGRRVSTSSGTVDPTNGSVVLFYTPQFGNPPRTLAVHAPACTPQIVHEAIARSELRDGTFTRRFRCKGGS